MVGSKFCTSVIWSSSSIASPARRIAMRMAAVSIALGCALFGFALAHSPKRKEPIAPNEPSGERSGTCRTGIGIPCYTIQGEETQWQLFRDGITDLREYRSVYTRAVRPDGSTVSLSDGSLERPFRRTKIDHHFSTLFLAPINELLSVDRQQKTISRREPLIWHDLPYRRAANGDYSCTTGILHFGTHYKMIGTGFVAGVPTVRWYGRNGANGFDEIDLAPSLDCIPLKTYRIHRNSFYVPTFVDTWKRPPSNSANRALSFSQFPPTTARSKTANGKSSRISSK
jgi:hypothetical protein